jgi:16S rRNA C967 or C1407 C5-methylase (RsmB/RsmF family)/NOL1/NOP2/fmu family ribosome biogenesis protein
LQIPEALIQSLAEVPGFNTRAFEEVHNSGSQVTSIRFNPARLAGAAPWQLLEALDPGALPDPVPWSTNGYYLSTRPSFTSDPALHAGAYYVQEASSMFLETVLTQLAGLHRPLKVLDLCAAPGGKSTLIQSLLTIESLLVSNEVIKTRVPVLIENTTKWGASNVIVTNNDPKDFQRLPDFFDVIVVDAPCSGSGLFRKDPAAVKEWSEQNVELCGQRQQRILADVLPSLKPGGLLVYSTCSYSVREDEDISRRLLSAGGLTSLQVQLEPSWNITETRTPATNGYGYRFYPDKLKGEGFYIAAFRREPPQAGQRMVTRTRVKADRVPAKDTGVLRSWLKNTDDFLFIRQQDEVLAIPLQQERDLEELRSALYVKKAGVKLGAIIRNELVPAHELALSSIIAPSIPSLEVNRATGLQFLRKQELPASPPLRGWVLVRYQQLALGWIKALPNRTNNYYPKDWRILHK